MITPALLRKVGAQPGRELPAYAWPGGYPIFYFAKDNTTYCAECAREVAKAGDDPEDIVLDSEELVSCFLLEGDEDPYCEKCGHDWNDGPGD
jgi:hypothetical protein